MKREDGDSRDFAQAFGDALLLFLDQNGMKQTDLADRLGLDKAGKARINTYCHKGERHKPNAEILYLLCTKLDFAFEYRGYKISATSLNGNGAKRLQAPSEQLTFEFSRQFNLTTPGGTVSVAIKRPPNRIEVSVSLKAALSESNRPA